MSPGEQILGGELEPLGPHEVGAYVSHCMVVLLPVLPPTSSKLFSIDLMVCI